MDNDYFNTGPAANKAAGNVVPNEQNLQQNQQPQPPIQPLQQTPNLPPMLQTTQAPKYLNRADDDDYFTHIPQKVQVVPSSAQSPRGNQDQTPQAPPQPAPAPVPQPAPVPVPQPEQVAAGQPSPPVFPGVTGPDVASKGDLKRSIPSPLPGPTIAAQSEEFENEEYYHGHLPIKDASEMLLQSGDFLLRVTEQPENGAKMLLSIQWNGTVYHVPVFGSAGTAFYIDIATPFQSISQLVDYYTTKTIEFSQQSITLANPIMRQPWELKHDQVNLIKKLGEGAFGMVFLGRFAVTARFRVFVAVKLLKKGDQNKKQREEMMTEARMTRDFRHPNIVRFYGHAVDHEPLLIVMEHVQEGALDTYLKRNGTTMSVETRMNMCCDASCGIEYLHAIPIMHRDISARNCLCGGKTLKLSDFGLSRKGDSYKMEPTERTPIRWTAPEVFTTAMYSLKADVWAFGILMWEIFSNADEPYKGWNGERVRAEVRKGYRMQLIEPAPVYAKSVFSRTMVANPDQRSHICIIANELRTAVGRPTKPLAGNIVPTPMLVRAPANTAPLPKPVLDPKAAILPPRAGSVGRNDGSPNVYLHYYAQPPGANRRPAAPGRVKVDKVQQSSSHKTKALSGGSKVMLGKSREDKKQKTRRKIIKSLASQKDSESSSGNSKSSSKKRRGTSKKKNSRMSGE